MGMNEPIMNMLCEQAISAIFKILAPYLRRPVDVACRLVRADLDRHSVFWQVGVRSLGVVFSAGWAAGFPQDDQHSWGRPPSLFCSFVGYLVMRAC